MIPLRLSILAVSWIAGADLLAAVLKVACIGDSITEGSGLGNPLVESYPARLQRVLGAGYQVRNFGVSGRTLLRKGDFPYWNEGAYTQSRNFEPDIVTIMLGTNDSKPYNWRYGTNFLTDYADLIASYTNLASHPRILLCTPCPVFGAGAFDIKPGTVSTNIAPAVRELAASLALEVIDLHSLLAGHREWFPDTVHPNSKGATVLAALFQTAIVGGSPSGTAPQVELGSGPINRVIVTWPVDWAGWVLQSTTALRGTNTAWTVVEQFAYNDGSSIQITNLTSGMSRIFRLWNPAP